MNKSFNAIQYMISRGKLFTIINENLTFGRFFDSVNQVSVALYVLSTNSFM